MAVGFKAIQAFIVEDNEGKAIETIQEIYRQFENTQQFPYMGADLSKRVRFKTDYKFAVWNDGGAYGSERYTEVHAWSDETIRK